MCASSQPRAFMLADDNKWREASVADNHDIFALVKRRRARIASGYGEKMSEMAR